MKHCGGGRERGRRGRGEREREGVTEAEFVDFINTIHCCVFTNRMLYWLFIMIAITPHFTEIKT